MRYIPVSAIIPLSILWFGIRDVQKFFIIFIGIFPILTIIIADIIRKVPKKYIDASRTFNLSTFNIYRKILFPASAPHIFDTCRALFGSAWTYIIVLEIVASDS